MKRYDKIALAFITLISVSLIFLINPDKTLAWDEAVHAMPGIVYIDYINYGLETGSWDYLEFIARYHTRFPVIYSMFKYPQLYEFTTIPFYILWGQNVVTSTLPSILFGAITLWFAYAFTRDKLGEKQGIIAMLFISTLPIFIQLSTEVVQDNAKLGLTFAWLYYFFKDEKFSWKKTFFQGLLLGGITFSRNLALPIIVSIVITYFILKALFQKKLDFTLLKRFTPQIIIALMLVTPWYHMSLITAGFLERLVDLGSSTNENLFPFYEKELLLQLGLFTPIIVYGAYTLHKKDRKTSILMLAFLLGTIVFGDLLPHKRFRYILQVLLPLSVWVAQGSASLIKKNKVFVPIIILIGLTSMYTGIVEQQKGIVITDLEETARLIEAQEDDLIIYMLNNQIDYGMASPETLMLEQMNMKTTSDPFKMPYFKVPQYDTPTIPENQREEQIGKAIKNTIKQASSMGYKKVYLSFYEQDEQVKKFIEKIVPTHDSKIEGKNLTVYVFK